MYEFARKLCHCYGLMAAGHSPTELAAGPALWNCSNEGQELNVPLRNTQRDFFLSMAEAQCQNTHGIICTVSVPVPAEAAGCHQWFLLKGGCFLSCSYSSTCCQQKLSNPHIFNFHTTSASLSV